MKLMGRPMRRTAARVRQMAAGIALAVASFAPTAAVADTLVYDSESCAADADGMVYVALARVVLRFPAEDLTLIRDLLSNQPAEMPSPPNPDEPEGCPDHPIQGRGFTFSYLYEAIRTNKRDPKLAPGRPNLLRLILAAPDFWGTQDGKEQFYSRICKRYQEQHELSNGLVGCWVPMKDRSQPREAWAVHLRAPASRYTAPFQRPFLVACDPRSPAGEQICRIGYKLYETVNISYEVTVQNAGSDRYVALDEIIEFDRGVRAQIEAARLRDYPWPKEHE